MKREFFVFLTPAAERSCKKLPRPVADFVFGDLAILLRDNAFAGKPLVSPLAPMRSVHFSVGGQPYRAAYEIEELSHRVIIHFVGYRGGFYERLRRLLGR